MSDDDFETYIRSQFPFRPDHPDYERLTVAVEQMEKWKADGISAEEAYTTLVDLYSVAYLAANRAWMNLPPPRPSVTTITKLTSHAWVEGFAHGVLFQQAGGTQQDADEARDQ